MRFYEIGLLDQKRLKQLMTAIGLLQILFLKIISRNLSYAKIIWLYYFVDTEPTTQRLEYTDHHMLCRPTSCTCGHTLCSEKTPTCVFLRNS